MAKNKAEITQFELVKNHLEKYKEITTWTAFKRYGVTRLSDIIYRLRKQGLNIKSINTTKINRYGNVCNFSIYTLED